MKLHWSPRSPFVRKVMIVAHEVGVADRLDCVRTVAATTTPNAQLMTDNPLSKLPTLVLDDGTPLYDSPVICEYFDTLHDGPKLFPADGRERMIALRRQALGDGMLDLLVLWRNEEMRPVEHRSAVHLQSFAARRDAVLASLEREAPALAIKRLFHRPHRAWLRPVLSRFPLRRFRLAQGSCARCRMARDLCVAAGRPSYRTRRRFLTGAALAENSIAHRRDDDARAAPRL
jgi:glutathione S-transferase